MKAIGERMKNNYETRSKCYLTRRIPVILRLDGKAFHTFTKGFETFDEKLSNSMIYAAEELAKEIQGCKLVYIQSDEASFLITDFDRLTTEAWFDYNIQKMASVSSSIFTLSFNKKIQSTRNAYFDSRVFNIPKEEVVNYFVWRQKDWTRNSVSMYTRSFFSHNECKNKSISDMHDMLYSIGKNWSNLSYKWKNGTLIDFTTNEVLHVSDFNKHKDIFDKILIHEK